LQYLVNSPPPSQLWLHGKSIYPQVGLTWTSHSGMHRTINMRHFLLVVMLFKENLPHGIM